MCVATSTAISIATLGATAGASIYGATKSAGASTHAADIESAAAQQALDFTKAQKAKQEAAYAPYAAAGAQAASSLPGMVRPMPTGGPPAPYTSQFTATAPARPLSAMGAAPAAVGPPPGMMPPAQGMAPAGPPQPGGVAPPAVGQGQMVTMQAPDGTTRPIPKEQVQFYLQKGAKVVGG